MLCRSGRSLTSVSLQIYIPYLDPALSETRGKILQLNYGFECACPSCIFLNTILPLPPLPAEKSDKKRLKDELRHFATIHSGIKSLPVLQLQNVPADLRCALREDYMSSLSEEFSKAAHVGDYSGAIHAGLSLLALYLVIYPTNYPQIGKFLD